MIPAAGAIWPIVKIVLEMLAGSAVAGGAKWGARKVAGRGLADVAGAAGRAFAGSGAGQMLGRGLTKAAGASPAWLARRMPTAESLVGGTVERMGHAGNIAAFIGGMHLAGPPISQVGQLLGLESDEAPTAYDWPAISAMPTPDRERERIALDEYAQQAALKQALQTLIGGEGLRRIV